MKYIKKYETYEISDSSNDGETYNYFFNTKNLDYKISIITYVDGYWSLGFKAKKPEDYFYEHDIIANDNPYQVMDIVIKTAKSFYFKKLKEIEDSKKIFNININSKDIIKGFVFSFAGNKDKNLQRLNLYKRYFHKFGMDTEFFNKEGIYYLKIK